MSTRVEDMQLHVTGWAPLMPGVEVTVAPCFDTREELFARPTYRDSLAFAASVGARLGTQKEHNMLWQIGFRLRPVIVRETAEETAARLARGGTNPLELMTSRAWCERHDRGLWLQCATWDGVRPLANAGKQWVGGAVPGRAWNYGWWDERATNGRRWQDLGTRHDDLHWDFSQLLTLFRDVPLQEAA